MLRIDIPSGGFQQSLCPSAICMMLDNWTKPRLTGVIMGSEFTLTTICIVTKCDKHIGYLPRVDCFEQGQARAEVVCSYQVDIYCQQNSHTSQRSEEPE